jgi:hypothetical protein
MRRNAFHQRAVLVIAAAVFAVTNILHAGLLQPSHQLESEGILDFLNNFKKTGRTGHPRQQYVPPLDMRYVGVAGLGHRLMRMSSAYHLARALQVPSLDVFWRGYCPKRYRSKPNVFHLLFGEDPFTIPSSSSNENHLFPFVNHDTAASLLDFVHGARNSSAHSNLTKNSQLKIINEVEGYTHIYESKDIEGLEPPFYGKLITDYEFYSRLIERYKFRTKVDELLAPYTNKHTIIGIHIRAGNGEVGDFEKFRQLGQGNLAGWLHNLTSLLRHHVLPDETLVIQGKPPLIFLATDTSSIVDYFQSNLGKTARILVAPQHYPSQGEGVSYSGDHANLTMCLDSWEYQMMDMVVLSEYTDILISGQYSSFTQSLPVSRILNDHERRRFFCDVDRLALALKCYDSTKGLSGWLSSDDTQARYLGAMEKVDKRTFPGPQIFFPIHLTAKKLHEMIVGERKRKPKR